MQKSLTRKPIEIKIATVVAVAVSLHQAEHATLEAALHEMTGNSPDFFDDEFAVIDVESIADQTLDWPAIIALFKSCGLHAVAVRNAADADHALIRSYGLSIDVVSKARPEIPAASIETPAQSTDQTTTQTTTEITSEATSTPTSKTKANAGKPAIEVQPEPAHEVTTTIAASSSSSSSSSQQSQPIPAMLIDMPVRAGQRVYARGCDLIITAVVNNGAEVIADGSIHIYAPLRGRALAGAMGNTNARIYVQTMEAELVSIAGIYRTFDNGFPALTAKMPVQIKLVGDSIDVSSLKTG